MTDPRLGVDFGRVINDGASHPSGDDTAFLSGTEAAVLATPSMPGAIDGLARLAAAFGGRVWIISKCGPRVQRHTELWLAHHRLFARIGVDASHLRFCRRRQDKAPICAELGITHFIDDRAEVLAHLRGVVEHRFLFGPQTTTTPDDLHAVPTWGDAQRAVLAALR